MSNDDKTGGGKPYTVGYGKPPKGTRFIKGRSGNPKGKPKGSKNLATLLAKTVNEMVIVHENGRRKSISKLQAATKQLANKAASGDPRATQLLLQMIQLYEDRPDAPAQTEAVDEADRMVMDQFFARLGNMAKGSDNGNSNPG